MVHMLKLFTCPTGFDQSCWLPWQNCQTSLCDMRYCDSELLRQTHCKPLLSDLPCLPLSGHRERAPAKCLKLADYPDQLREKGSCRLRSDVPQRSHPSGISGISGIIDVLWIHLRNLGTSWPNGTMTDSHGFPPSLQASKPPSLQASNQAKPFSQTPQATK